MKYKFYYDESEHSRRINSKTISSDNYYDNFISVIVGWEERKELSVEEKYFAFEQKYADRMTNGELKSSTFKNNQLKYGFASLNKQNVEMIDDFLSLIEDDFYLYFFCASKIEYIVIQLLRNYRSTFFINIESVRYSIVKAIVTYRPESVIRNIESSPGIIVNTLIEFLEERIEINKSNITLKRKENQEFENIIFILRDLEPINSFDWNYHMQFDGFAMLLKNLAIDDYSLTIDKEGANNKRSKTLNSAKDTGLINCNEIDSKQCFGIRMADILAGIIGKLMKSLFKSLHKKENNEDVRRKLLEINWFQLNSKQLLLYKKLYHIILEINNDWYKIYAGNYSDDLVCFLALLDFMNHFENTEEIKKDFQTQPEYCNWCMCSRLSEHYKRM